jgi:NTP pyrophosphatase (non-canonical NTP hydrolase)
MGDNMQETIQNIENWAKDRNLILGSTPQAQMLKLTEEIGELARGIAKQQPEIIADSIGDCVVVLTIIAKQCGFTLEGCVSGAYEEIKDRKGRMVDGVFVKEE